MFGVINPPSNFMGPGSVAQQMPSATSNSSDMAAMMAYTNSLTKGNDAASNWGQNIDISGLPDWAKSLALENVMYTRAFLGANPDVLQADGSIKMDTGAPLMIPTDMANVNNAVDSSSTAGAANAGSSPASSSSASAAPAASTTAAKGNGAASTAASSALLGVAALAAAVLAF